MPSGGPVKPRAEPGAAKDSDVQAASGEFRLRELWPAAAFRLALWRFSAYLSMPRGCPVSLRVVSRVQCRHHCRTDSHGLLLLQGLLSCLAGSDGASTPQAKAGAASRSSKSRPARQSGRGASWGGAGRACAASRPRAARWYGCSARAAAVYSPGPRPPAPRQRS